MNRVRALGIALAMGLSFTASAQEPPATASADASSSAGARAPSADERQEIAALEPAVNVSRPAPSTAAAPGTAPASDGAESPPSGQRPRVMDRLDLGTTSITGNQELPKVLYIVPWKQSDLGDLIGRPVDTLLDEVLAPIDPEVFERHLDYYETLYGGSEKE